MYYAVQDEWQPERNDNSNRMNAEEMGSYTAFVTNSSTHSCFHGIDHNISEKMQIKQSDGSGGSLLDKGCQITTNEDR